MQTWSRWVLGVVAITACAATSLNLPRLSARAMTPTPYPDSVAISEVHEGRLGTVMTWVATTRTGVYDCSLEPRERTPLCVKREVPR